MSPLLAGRKLTVFLRRLPGTHPLIEPIRRRFYGAGVVRVSDFDGSMRMDLDLGEHMASQIFWFGYYSRDVLYALDRLLQSGDTFIDVGANIGEVTLFAAHRVGPRGLVIAFEPLADIARNLRSNVRLNGFQHAEISELGLSSKTGEETIYVSSAAFNDGSVHRGLGTFYPSETRPQSAGTVKVTSLDAFVKARGIAHLHGIKLDIEGGELDALRGAGEVLERFRPWLLIEIGEETCRAAGYEPAAILDLLEPLDYEHFRILRKGRLEPVTSSTLGAWQNILSRRRRAAR